jgi:hypothetical protein
LHELTGRLKNEQIVFDEEKYRQYAVSILPIINSELIGEFAELMKINDLVDRNCLLNIAR